MRFACVVALALACVPTAHARLDPRPVNHLSMHRQRSVDGRASASSFPTAVVDDTAREGVARALVAEAEALVADGERLRAEFRAFVSKFGKEAEYAAKWRAKGAADVSAQLERLTKMAAGAMKPEAAKWLKQRSSILKQLAAATAEL